MWFWIPSLQHLGCASTGDGISKPPYMQSRARARQRCCLPWSWTGLQLGWRFSSHHGLPRKLTWGFVDLGPERSYYAEAGLAWVLLEVMNRGWVESWLHSPWNLLPQQGRTSPSPCRGQPSCSQDFIQRAAAWKKRSCKQDNKKIYEILNFPCTPSDATSEV